MSSTARSEVRVAIDGGDAVLHVRRVAGAKAMRLSVDPRDGAVRLTLPPRAALKPALAWAESRGGWIARALAAVPARVQLVPGATVPLRGREATIAWRADAGRQVVLAGDRLLVGGAIESVGGRVLRWLRAEARAALEAESRAAAARAGVTIGAIRIGDTRSRWASCSAKGDLAYSWRLILAPDFVRLATVTHEVAHRLHMDHSPAFHAAHTRLLGHDPAPARAWLRAHGAALHRYG